MGKEFLKRFVRGKWIIVVASFYIKFFGGPNYVFGLYSIPIKASMKYNQKTIDTLSFFKDLGQNMGIFAGLLSEYMPAWVVLTLGATLNLAGYMMIWLSVTHRIPHPPLWQMYLFMCVAANAHPFMNTPVIVTCLNNFPHCRGTIIGFIRGFAGLSGAIFTQLYYSLYNVNGNNTQNVLLLLAWLPGCTCLFFMFFIKPFRGCTDFSEEDAQKQERHFLLFLYIALILATFLILVTVIQSRATLSFSTHKVIASIVLILLASNIVIAIKAEVEDGHQKFEHEKDDNHLIIAAMNMATIRKVTQDERLPDPKEASEPGKMDKLNHQDMQKLVADAQTTPKSKGAGEHENSYKETPSSSPLRLYLSRLREAFAMRGTKIGEDFTVPEALTKLDLWILLFATMCGQGGALAAIGNIGQIGESFGYTSGSISALVSLMNIWIFLGRLFAGFASEKLMKKQGTPRPIVLTLSILVGCVGHLLIAMPKAGSLYGASMIVGLSFGMQGTLFSAILSELFGLKHYATLFNVGSLAGPLGSYILNVRVAGHFYDQQTAQQGDDGTCTGSHCFDRAFFIIASVSFLGGLISVFLVSRTLSFYKHRMRAPSEKEERR
ncbi:hypothetical protein KP509_32G001200 [Ceratopteris richardii]|nr:hypothetical protein KP509_32G001200 [Ceratopteris richardii]